MRQTILLTFLALLAAGASHHACAQRRGGAAPGFARGARSFSRARAAFPSRFAYLPYGSGYDYAPYDLSDAYAQAPEPVILVQPPPEFVEPPPAPVAKPVGHPVIKEYKWPAADEGSSAASSPASDSQPQTFTLILKDGSTRSAVMIFASEDGLHYVDTDERCLRISMSEVDRAATLNLNRARNLNLHLPAAK